MKLAVIAVTARGARLAEQLTAKLPFGADVFVKQDRNPGVAATEYSVLSSLVAETFGKYDGFIFIMATGIVVRVLAPHINDKRFDPAVVVMDEAGQYAISLLSGHIGGANELAKLAADAVEACPVITTATDVNYKPAADMLAVKLELNIEPFENLKTVNAAIAAGEEVAFFLDPSLAEKERYMRGAAEMDIELRDIADLNMTETYDAAVVISDKELYMAKPYVYLRPAILALGIGCRRGTTSAELFAAIEDACRRVGRSPKSIAVICTTTAKQDEIGLLAASQQLVLPLHFFTNEELQQAIDEWGLSKSEFVEETIGVGNVCEAAAMLGGRANRLVLPKTKYPNVAIALAEVKYRWWE